MPEGFKLLDAYVEVTASGKGLAQKVGADFKSEAPAAAKSASSSFGTGLMDGFKALPSVGGNLAEKVGDDFEKESPAVARRASSSFGTELAGGIKDPATSAGSSGGTFFGGAFSGIMGGLVVSLGYQVMSSISSTIDSIGGLLAGVGKMVASTVISFNSELQNATIGFTTMLGSGAKAQSFLKQLQDFAKATPFEFQGLVSNAQQMLGMGIAAKNVIPDLTALGDSVAAMGGSADQVNNVVSAFDQMNAKGTLDMGNIEQIAQQGVPSALKILAAGFHTTTGGMIDMISSGKVLSSTALPMLITGIEKGTKSTAALGGMMTKQSATFTGALSNIQDGLTQTVSKAFKPFFDVASKGMLQFANSLTSKPAVKFQKDVTAAIQPIARNIGKWLSGIDLSSIFTKGSKAVASVSGAFTKMKPDLDNIGKTLLPAVSDAIGTIIKHLPEFLKGLESVVDETSKWAPFIAAVIKAGGNLIGWLVDSTSAFSKWHDDTMGSIEGVATKMVGLPKRIASGFAKLPGMMQQAGKDAIAGLVKGIGISLPDVESMVGTVVNAVKNVFTGGLEIKSPSKVFEKYGTWVNQGLAKGLLGSIDQIKQASTDLSDAVKSAFSTTNMTSSQEKSALATIKSTTKELVADAKGRDAAVTALSNAKDKLAGLKSDKADYASTVKSNALSGFDVGTLVGNGDSQMDTYTQAKADYASQMADYNKGLADAQATDAATVTSSTAAAGSLNGDAHQSSYTTSVTGGTAVADYLKNTAVPTDDSGTKPLTGVAAIKANLKKLLADTKSFTAGLKKLVKAGIDKTTLQQLIDAGPTAGLEIVNDLLADPTGMKDIVSLQNQLGTADTSLANYTSGQFYDKQIGAAQTAVNRDQHVVNQYTVQMTIDASKIDEVQKMIAMLNTLSATAKAKKAKK